MPPGHQQSTETDESGAPLLRRVGVHLSTLERRRVHLERQLEDGFGSQQSRQFARAEVAALTVAEIALKYHRNTVTRMDEPLTLLREMIAAYEGPVDAEGKLRALVKRAKLMLEEFEP